MPLEYSYLVASVLLYLVMIMVQATAGIMHHGLPALAGPRDELKPDGPFAGRAKRASANMLENLALFAPLVIVAVETGRTSDLTQIGAGLFLAARIIYAPSYWFGIAIRSLAWFAGLAGILIVASQILPFTTATA